MRSTFGLKTKEMLNLVPGAYYEGDGDGDEDEHHDVEAVAGEAALLAAQDAGMPLGAVVAVPQVDGGAGVDRGVVGRG